PYTTLFRSGQFVELEGAFGQDLALLCCKEFLGNHRWGPREEPVGMRIIGGPENLVRAQVLGQIRQAALDGLKGDPALPPEILAGPQAQRGVIENPAILEVAVHAI